jgi:hypothetical protein
LGAGGVGVYDCCAARDDIAHVFIWKDVEEHEEGVNELEGEEEDDWEDGDDVAVGEEEVCEALKEGAEEEPC